METELERLELSLHELPLELRSLDLLLAKSPIVVDAPGHADDADVRREPRGAAERQRRVEHGREISRGFPRIEDVPEDVRGEQVQQRAAPAPAPRSASTFAT